MRASLNEAKRITSSAKTRDKIVRLLNPITFPHWGSLDILFITTEFCPNTQLLVVSVGVRKHFEVSLPPLDSILSWFSVGKELFPSKLICHNCYKANQRSRSMASKYSHTQVLASATTIAVLLMVCQYLPAASNVPQVKQAQ